MIYQKTENFANIDVDKLDILSQKKAALIE